MPATTFTKIYLSAVLFVILTVSASGQGTAARAAGRIALQPCEVPSVTEGKKQSVLCGTYDVLENRRRKDGRRITLKVVVFPATGANKLADPLFYIPGGPGSSATEDAPYVAQQYAKIRERRDLVFVDQRGTGGSNPLNCDFFDPADVNSYLAHWNPLADVRKCRKELEAKADLKLYVTSIAMDDLDEVRSALGYQKINITGGSYGTRAAQEYLRRYGNHVRTAILHGVSPTSQLMPRDFPQHTERALNGVIDECARDYACRSAFPNLRAEVRIVLDTLRRAPINVDVKATENAEKTTRVKLSRDLAAEAVRYLLYQSGSAGRVPLFLHLAAHGNYAPLAEAAIFFRQQIVATGSNGMYLSVTCAEDLPWIRPGEGERNAENTFLGDYRLRQQREACTLWPRGEIHRDYAKPTRSSVPVLILSGQWDPVTPPLYGDEAARHLRNSLHVVVPSGGHGFGGLEGLDCISKLTDSFIDQGTAAKLDIACVQQIRRKGFPLKLADPLKSP